MCESLARQLFTKLTDRQHIASITGMELLRTGNKLLCVSYGKSQILLKPLRQVVHIYCNAE
jgi:hypothetical protein